MNDEFTTNHEKLLEVCISENTFEHQSYISTHFF